MKLWLVRGKSKRRIAWLTTEKWLDRCLDLPIRLAEVDFLSGQETCPTGIALERNWKESRQPSVIKYVGGREEVSRRMGA
jgi:hypothetical protein